jgi:thiamine-phosphate pyrophosphorylase
VDFRCYLIADRHQTGGRPLVAALQTAAAAGIKAMQLREKDLTPRELFALAEEARDVVRPRGAHLFINDRADIACAASLDGVHLPATGMSPRAARRCLASDMLIGVSTHSLVEARFAESMGADFITFGPVFFTASKAPYGAPRGLVELAEVCSAVQLPVFALGGIVPAHIPSCLDAGAHGVAAISALLDGPDIADRVGAFAEALGGL